MVGYSRHLHDNETTNHSTGYTGFYIIMGYCIDSDLLIRVYIFYSFINQFPIYASTLENHSNMLTIA